MGLRAMAARRHLWLALAVVTALAVGGATAATRAEDGSGATLTAAAGAAEGVGANVAETSGADATKKKLPLAYTSFHSEHSEKVTKKKKGLFKAFIAKEALKSASKPMVYMSGGGAQSQITADGLREVADS